MTVALAPTRAGRRTRLDPQASNAWGRLLRAARTEGIPAPLLVPLPGRTGTVVDVYLGCPHTPDAAAALRRTPVYNWLASHAGAYGFLPDAARPWRWRYEAELEEEAWRRFTPEYANTPAWARAVADRARRLFVRVRPDRAGALGVTPGDGNHVHHAVELQVLRGYPYVFTSGQLNRLDNLRKVEPDTHRQLRLYWNEKYRQLDQQIAANPQLALGLQVARSNAKPEQGTTQAAALRLYQQFVRTQIAKAALEADATFGLHKAAVAHELELPGAPGWAGELAPRARRNGRRSPFLKDDPGLQAVPLGPAAPLQAGPGARRSRELAMLYNRLGGLMTAVAARANVDVTAVLAVWSVESGGEPQPAGQATLRFENHLLWRLWGRRHPEAFDAWFGFGGRQGRPGRAWEGHRFREAPNGPWITQHVDGRQDLEYRALAVACRLAGEDVALQCASIGGPQILLSWHQLLGYPTPKAMWDAFQAGDRWQVLGFVDLCAHRRVQDPAEPAPGDLLSYLRRRDWSRFAYWYNGPGQVARYAAALASRHAAAQALLGR